MLNVTNAGGLAAGTYTLFTCTGTLSGGLAFGSMPPGFKFVLATNVAGQVNLLVVKPTITTAARSSTNLIFTGTGGMATSNYYVLTSTNLALPLTNWTRITTNIFNPEGGFAVTNNLPSGGAPGFYRLQMP